MIADEYLLAALRQVSGHDPIPAHVSAAARDTYSLRLPHAVTAAPVECPPTREIRGPEDLRLIRFVAAGLVFDLEMTIGDGLIDVAGQLTPHPGKGAWIVVRTPHMSLTCDVVGTGRFAATGLPPGWLSVVCHRPGHDPVATRWVRVRP